MPYRPPAKIADVLISERFRMREIIAGAVDSSFRLAGRALSGSAGEVDKLIYFFMHGLPAIEAGFRQALSRRHVSITVSGIFCHQTPKVRAMQSGQGRGVCELGDIAFLATYGTRLGYGGKGRGNAVLLQAKSNFRSGISSTQRALYEECEDFIYASPQLLRAGKRDLRQANGCLYYWDFGSAGSMPKRPVKAGLSEAIVARPRSPAGSYYVEPFENMLADLFCGIGGRGFRATPGTSNRWSKIIKDIVTTAATRAIQNKRVFGHHGFRPPRLFNYSATDSATGRSNSFVRCSIQEFFAMFEDRDLNETGKKLETEAEEYRQVSTPVLDRTEGGHIPPRVKASDYEDEGDGGSFVVFQFNEA